MILNLTQHPATQEQVAQDVRDLLEPEATALRAALTFENLPTPGEMWDKACEVTRIACEHFGDRQFGEYVMIGGAPFFMPVLTQRLREAGFRPVCAFSRRESAEETLPDGSVRKVAVFRHAGFVEI